MKSSRLIILIFFPIWVMGIPIELPHWITKIDTVLHTAEKAHAEIKHNAVWYEQSQKQLSHIISQFDKAQVQREQLILCVANALHVLNNNLLTCQSNVLACQAYSLNAQSACDMTIAGLEGSVLSLEGSVDLLQASIQLIQQQAQATVDSLNAQIISLHDELTAIQEYYEHLICIDETQAEALVGQIHAFRKKYDELVTHRAQLLETLDHYNVQTAVCIKNSNVQLDLLNPLCKSYK